MTIIKKLERIEERYNLYKYDSWHYLRVAFIFSARRRNHNSIKISQKISLFRNKINSIKNIFYGFKNWFKKYKYIVFDVNDDYREIDHEILSRLTEDLSNNFDRNDILHIQSLGQNNLIPTKDFVVSDTIIRLLSLIIEKFYTYKIDFDYENINNELKIKINYKKEYNRLIIRKNIIKIILRIYKPKLVFITCYTKREFIIASKELSLPTIEIQHGILNIPGYISKTFNKKYQPDYLIVFGQNDKKLLLKNSNYIHNKNSIIPVGSYLLEYILKKKSYVLDKYKSKFKYIISVSVQDMFLEDTVKFITDIAKINKNILFILIPRNLEISINKQNNILVFTNTNCLEIVKQSDFHLTIFSTCAYEAASLGIPNIFWNYNNLSIEYCNEYINDKNYNFIVNNKIEFSELLKKDFDFNKDKIITDNKDYFMPNYKKNMERFLKKVLNDSK